MAKKTERPVAGEAPEAPGPPKMDGPIDRISLVGFKSHKRSLNLALKPITLLAGGNSSGKSSLMQPLLLMKQTIETPFEPPPLHLGGPIVTLDNAEDLFWRGDDGERAKVWSVALHFGECSVEVTYRRESSEIGGLAIHETKVCVDGAPSEINIRAGMPEDEIFAAMERVGRFETRLSTHDFGDPYLNVAPVEARCAYDVYVMH
ncbi:hypothetical protein L6R46_17225, partial [Myxococcota bacterium]|nr:hypothetical protein [Myxococcota bacterium]